MATIDENIEALSQKMLSDAKAEAEQIVAAAQAKAEAIRKRAEEQAAAERKDIIDRAQQEVERLRSQSLATTQLKARNMQLEYREKLLDTVFAAAREKLPAVQHYSNYDKIAADLLKEALQHLKDFPVQVHVDAFTQKSLQAQNMQQIAKDLNVEIKDTSLLKNGTGVIVETADGHLNYDNTLETRLNRLQSLLRAPVYHILMGEKV